MNSVAVITGASSGIGRAYACQLAKSHDLILIARRECLMKQLSEELKNYGNKIEIIVADLSKDSDVLHVESILSNIKADILINCAGIGDTDHFHEIDTTILNDMINLHVVAPSKFSRAVIPGMIKNNHGIIINVASVAGFTKVNAGSLAYNVTKAYLIKFSQLLQQDYHLKDKVKVQLLCPGYTRTEFFNNLKQNVKIPEFMWMNPDDVVKKSLMQIKSGKKVCIPGWYNVLIAKIIGSVIFIPLLKFANKYAEKNLDISL